MIAITHVTRRFGRHVAVRDVSLSIAPGESVALWGPNGAGKTTLIRCVLGLIRCSGRIEVAGRSVRRRGKAARRLIGYVPQELGFYDELGVSEAIRYFARLKGLRAVRPAQVLESVGLAGHGAKRVRELSGGMKQRLALAIALLGDPPVLVLDEVTASLDAVGRGEFVRLLEGLSGAGRTLLFASHRIEEVSTLARRVAVLEKGRLSRVQTCADFADSLGRSTMLHLVMPVAVRARAVESLRAVGFPAQLNGVGIVVPVSQDRKAAPFRILADARVPIDDFEIVPVGKAEPGAAHHQGEAR
ncbi:MAG: ABC transporter ATP-binding protein [Phycisphaerales bacterium]|nr:ABC transporter ATP-binding protein [Phycisphaerales bacterium]